MTPEKPNKTAADLLIIGLSPVLIMLLVGSLCFFLIEVFFRGEAIGSVRWVMFWFVMAVVLVSRIGIEQGTAQAAVYGLLLAVATWLYLMRIHPAFILGALLLGIVWWCAHQLTWDCTLIDEDEDASGGGLLETVYKRTGFQLFAKKRVVQPEAVPQPKPAAVPHAPGLWVVWFSIAALPLFGIGQMLLPRADAGARHAGFVWLLVYVSAALGLLLTTSFLGLRRYLRQRYLAMPGLMALGWLRFGGGVAVLVLVGALLLPRPGATAAWETLSYHINSQLRHASNYAARFGPHGSGAGRAGNELDTSAAQPNATDPAAKERTPGQSPEKETGKSPHSEPNPQPPSPPQSADHLFQWLRGLFILLVACLLGWWLWRNREVLRAMARSLLAAIRQFFQDLFRRGEVDGAAEAASGVAKAPGIRFAAFQNPFLTGKEGRWTPERLVVYSYEALQAWAGENGVQPHPQQTSREFCTELAGRFPEINEQLRELSLLYGHAAYGVAVPPQRDLEPVKQIWRFLRA